MIEAFSLTLALLAGTPDWPGFLGAGVAAEMRPESLPLVWSPEKNIAWKSPLPGYGQSSPVVSEGRVFVTSVEGPLKDTCHVIALDLADGHEL